MNLKRKNSPSIAFNFIMSFFLRILGPLCAAISYPYAFQVIGQAQMGRVAFSTSTANIFFMIAGFGISTYGIRECAKVRDDHIKLSKTVYELLAIQVITTAIAECLLFLLVIAVPRFHIEWRLFLVQSVVLLFHCLNTDWFFSGLEQYGFLAVRSSFVKILSVVLILTLVNDSRGYLLYCALTAGTTAAVNLLNFPVVQKKLVKNVGQLDLRPHFLPAFIFFIQVVAIAAYTNLDVVLLGLFKDNDVVGSYDAAVKVKMILTYYITNLGTVLLPRFSYYYEVKNQSALKRGIELSTGFVWITALPLTLYFLVLSPTCLKLLYGKILPNTLSSLYILVFTLLPIGFSNLFGIQILIPQHREDVVMRSVIAGAAVDLVADLLLIPRNGAIGAAVGTLLAEATVLAVQVIQMRQSSMGYRFHIGWRRLLAIAVTFPLLFLLAKAPGRPLFKVLFSAAAYFGITYTALFCVKDPVVRLAAKRACRLVKFREENDICDGGML